MKIFLSLVASLLFYGLTESKWLECNFTVKEEDGYSCLVKSTEEIISRNDQEVSKIYGEHKEERLNDDVIYFSMSHLRNFYFPRGLTKFFKNLQAVAIYKSGLKEIVKEDLKEFGENLKELWLKNNAIEVIEADLFEFTPNLVKFSVSSNAVHHIESGAFDSLKNLENFYFHGNPCKEFETLQETEKNCKDPSHVSRFWCQNKISNFTKKIEDDEEKIEKMSLEILDLSKKSEEDSRKFEELSKKLEEEKNKSDTCSLSQVNTKTSAMVQNCRDTWNIKDLNGFVYKKICRFPQSSNFSFAHETCIRSGMRLLTIRNQREFEATEGIMRSVWGMKGGVRKRKHVDGARGFDNVWRYFDGQPLWQELIPEWNNGSEKNHISIHGDGKGGYYPVAHLFPSKSWFLCEFDVEYAPPTGPPRTLKAPNFSFCPFRFRRNITDPSTGVAYKGICRVAEGVNFATASSRCIGYGMRLLTIRNQREFDAALTLDVRAAHHVDGWKGLDGIWRFWDGTNVPPFLIPIDGFGIFQNSINIAYERSSTFAVDDDVTSFYLCEYRMKNQ